jgi:hypothetical protein
MVPLAAYGIKIRGAGYEKWPQRYQTVFNHVRNKACNCPAWTDILVKVNEILNAFGYSVGPDLLPSSMEAMEIAREEDVLASLLQSRALELYEGSFGDSTGPTEDKWRHDIESIVFDRLLGR